MLPHTRGKDDPKGMYSGGTLFVDHTSGYIKPYNQVLLGASDTVRIKELFEIHSSEMGVKAKSYHGKTVYIKLKPTEKI